MFVYNISLEKPDNAEIMLQVGGTTVAISLTFIINATEVEPSRAKQCAGSKNSTFYNTKSKAQMSDICGMSHLMVKSH